MLINVLLIKNHVGLLHKSYKNLLLKYKGRKLRNSHTANSKYQNFYIRFMLVNTVLSTLESRMLSLGAFCIFRKNQIFTIYVLVI